MMAIKPCLLLLLSLSLLTTLSAQVPTADEYFQMARKEAFDNKNYGAAIHLARQALLQSPGYTDIEVFLGRVYYWDSKKDSSLQVLTLALENNPSYEEAAIAIADVAYYIEDYTSSLGYCSSGLRHHPRSSELMFRTARALAAMNRNREASLLADSLLEADPRNTALRSLAERIRDVRAKSKIGLAYDYTWFDKQFASPWHLVSLDYNRSTHVGSIIARINYANRHKTNGLQFELDGYPRISKTFYAYANVGYSADMPVFPKFRAGFSLYANLPGSFEADAGFRYLNFDNSTWIYTFAIGKYVKNFWFNGRAYLTPSNSRMSHSYAVTTRYYLKGADDYFSFSAGTGISPDDRSLTAQLNSSFKLKTRKIAAGYRFTAGKMNIIGVSASFDNVEYRPKTTGNQGGLSMAYMRRF